jgi:transposase
METIAQAAVSRKEWQKRVTRWKKSGLTAKVFAAELGINAGTLQYWQYKLKYGDRLDKPPRPGTRSDAIVASLVEVAAPAVATEAPRFEVELGNGRRVWVAVGFDGEALRMLLAILEAT